MLIFRQINENIVKIIHKGRKNRRTDIRRNGEVLVDITGFSQMLILRFGKKMEKNADLRKSNPAILIAALNY